MVSFGQYHEYEETAVYDEIDLKEASELYSYMHTKAMVEIDPENPNVAILTQNGTKFKVMIDVQGEEIENYTFKVGNAQYSAGSDKKEYDALDYVYRRYEGAPYMYSFESGKYIGEAEVKYIDHNGNEVAEDQLTEQYFLNNCDKQLNDRLAQFGELFINRYVDFGAVNGGYFFGNYALLKEVMQPDSEIWQRITDSWGIIFYGNTEYCKIHNLKVNICSQLADNLYLVDVSYDTETKAPYEDPVWDDNFARVVAVENEEGNLVTVSMYNY